MLGSSFSISDPNIVLNTIVADVLSEFADRLEKADNFEKELKSLMKETIKKHKRIIFNGNNYSDEWTKEAEKRGLLNLRTTVDAIPHFINKKNIQLFAKNGIFSEIEMRSRYEIMLENYCKVLNIEVLTMLEIVRRSIMPAATAYSKQLSETAAVQKSLGIDVSDSAEIELAKRISMLNTQLYNKANQLEDALSSVNSEQDFLSRAEGFRDNIVVKMKDLRCVADCLETIVAKEYWPFPTYEELLFSV